VSGPVISGRPRPTSMFVNIRQSLNCEQFHRNSWAILIQINLAADP